MNSPSYDNIEDGALLKAEKHGLLPSSAENPMIYCPDTGGRFLGTRSASSSAQVVHLYYVFPEQCPVDVQNVHTFPSYFAIVSGKDVTSIWLLEHSHKFARETKNNQRLPGKVLKPNLVYVKP